MDAVRTWHDDTAASSAMRQTSSSALFGGRAPAPAPTILPSRTLDRAQGDGPPVVCCSRRYVAADMLVRVPDALVDRVRQVIPALVGPGPHYLCDACMSTLIRTKHATWTEFHISPIAEIG
jgi:hypothetical protein